jgi:hypothetical protein
MTVHRPANDNHRGGIIPRGLRRVDAARYLGISATHFDKQVREGTISAPLQLFGVKLWDRTALDSLFDGTPSANDEWDSVLRHDEETQARPRLH